MGQKTHPIGFRIGVSKGWKSRWFAKGSEYRRMVHEDKWIRDYVKEKLAHAAVSDVEIERAADKMKIIIHSARPGLVIGKKGAGIETLRLELIKKYRKDVAVNIQEIKKAELDAQLVAENVAMQIVRRVAFRRAMKKAVQSSLKMGAEGIRIQCSGRLGGAEIARSEWYREGRVPLHTLRADIDFGYATANTTYGIIGVRCWVYRGDVMPA